MVEERRRMLIKRGKEGDRVGRGSKKRLEEERGRKNIEGETKRKRRGK